jgi:hypothetical protein
MKTNRKHKKPDWRKYLTEEEKILVGMADTLRERWAAAAAMRHVVVNRAVQRARRAAK